MLTIDTTNLFIKIFSLILCCCYIFIRVRNISKMTTKQIVMALLPCFILSPVFIVLRMYLSVFFITIMFLFIGCLYLSLLLKIKFEFSIPVMLLSFGLSLVIYSISGFISGIVYQSIGNSYNDSIFYLLHMFVQLSFTYAVFSIKRFKNGFPFLMRKNAGIYGVLFTGVVLLLSALITESKSDVFVFSLIFGIIICGAGTTIWIRRGITMFYKKKIKERSIEILEEQLREKELELERVTAENAILSSESHKINHRLSMLERQVKFLTFEASKEKKDSAYSDEYADVLDQIKIMAEEYSNEMKKIPKNKSLSSTKIKSIDFLFDHFWTQSLEKNIDFNLKVNGSMNYMIEKIIDKSKLEIMIGDHVKDAIIALDSSNHVYRSILVLLGLAGDCYELSIYDSGIEFEMDTLLNLGLKRVTTHAETGGSGIGFMTTFETMRESGASLIIEEKPPSNSDFTKSVSIRFDGKGQYIVRTYRAEALSALNNREIIIENTNP